MATTYAELQTEALAWTRNTAVADQIANCISQAEDEINAKTRGVRRVITATTTIDTDSSAVPSDFQDVRSFQLTSGSNRTLRPVSVEEMARLRAESPTTDEPYAFCVQGAAFEFYPTPDTSYDAELVYTGRLARLSDSNTTNWVLAEFPSVYLNGTLWRAYSFLKNREMAEYYGALFLSGLDDLKAANRTVRAPTLRTDFPLAGPCATDMTRA